MVRILIAASSSLPAWANSRASSSEGGCPLNRDAQHRERADYERKNHRTQGTPDGALAGRYTVVSRAHGLAAPVPADRGAWLHHLVGSSRFRVVKSRPPAARPANLYALDSIGLAESDQQPGVIRRGVAATALDLPVQDSVAQVDIDSGADR